MSTSFIVRDTTQKFEKQSPLRRVSKKNLCPICNKPDWCTVTENGCLAFCMRVSAGSIRQAANNAFIHVLKPYWDNRVSALPAPAIRKAGNAETKRADADRLHAVYSYLLEDCLTLRQEHGSHLLNERGLSDTAIAAKLYASTPSKDDLPVVLSKMHEKFGDKLRGVPGFYRNPEGVWLMPKHEGFFIPIRDVEGRIVALMIRCDEEWKPKYLWFSTNPENYPFGTTSGVPIHFVKPDLVTQTKTALITEGALKADIISEYKDMATIAIAGVKSFNVETFGAELRRAIPSLSKAIIAFDADWKTNPQVKDGLNSLRRSLKAAALEIIVRDWDVNYGKGFDDALANSERKNRTR